jgi:hypothetical protein
MREGPILYVSKRQGVNDSGGSSPGSGWRQQSEHRARRQSQADRGEGVDDPEVPEYFSPVPAGHVPESVGCMYNRAVGSNLLEPNRTWR